MGEDEAKSCQNVMKFETLSFYLLLKSGDSEPETFLCEEGYCCFHWVLAILFWDPQYLTSFSEQCSLLNLNSGFQTLFSWLFPTQPFPKFSLFLDNWLDSVSNGICKFTVNWPQSTVLIEDLHANGLLKEPKRDTSWMVKQACEDWPNKYAKLGNQLMQEANKYEGFWCILERFL